MRDRRMTRKWLLTIRLLAFALLGRSPSSASPGLAPTDVHTALPASPQACSSFCLDNGDHCLFGTNQDNSIDAGLMYVNKRGVLKPGWDPSTSGQYAHWIAKYGSVTFVHAGYQMAWAGMNEAGLMISTMATQKSRKITERVLQIREYFRYGCQIRYVTAYTRKQTIVAAYTQGGVRKFCAQR